MINKQLMEDINSVNTENLNYLVGYFIKVKAIMYTKFYDNINNNKLDLDPALFGIEPIKKVYLELKDAKKAYQDFIENCAEDWKFCDYILEYIYSYGEFSFYCEKEFDEFVNFLEEHKRIIYNKKEYKEAAYTIYYNGKLHYVKKFWTPSIRKEDVHKFCKFLDFELEDILASIVAIEEVELV